MIVLGSFVTDGRDRKRLERLRRYLARPPTIALHERFGFTQIARDVWLHGVKFEGGAGLLFRAPVEPRSPR